MASTIIDSRIFGDMFSDACMRDVWSDAGERFAARNLTLTSSQDRTAMHPNHHSGADASSHSMRRGQVASPAPVTVGAQPPADPRKRIPKSSFRLDQSVAKEGAYVRYRRSPSFAGNIRPTATSVDQS